MLDYPDTTKPVRIGINIDRFQQRTGERSWWCNLGVNEFRENDGHWINVLPPPRKRELKLLPYIIGGISETKTDERDYTARAGMDLRYEVTPQLRLIGTANPDFDNIEQAVEGIDFSYGERYVPDRRPFFSEGGNIYRARLFHSRRIVDMDGGLKLFGKLGKNTSVGTLGTYHRNNQNAIFHASQSLTATSSLNASFLSHHHRHTGMNNVGYLEGDVHHGKFSAQSALIQSWADQSDGSGGNVIIGYNGQFIQSYLSAFFIDPDFVNRLGFHPFTGFRGVGLDNFSFGHEWRGGFIRSASVSVQGQASNTYDGEVFQRYLYVSSRILTHSDYALSAGWRGGRFEEFSDSVFSVGLRARASDRFNNVSINYSWGEQADEQIHRISGNLNLRAYGFTAGLTSQIQWHFERRYQQILTLTYDFSPALSLGSRLIWQVKGTNIYFALRRSGYAGTDFFIILGDPNALEFKQRLVAKVIRAF